MIMYLVYLVLALALQKCAAAHPGTLGTDRQIQHFDSYLLDSNSTHVNAANASSYRGFAGPVLDDTSHKKIALKVAQATVPSGAFRVLNDYYVGNNGVAHVHFKQTILGIDIDNTHVNVNIGRGGKLLSYGYTCYYGPTPAPYALRNGSHIDPVSALKAVSDILNLSVHSSSVSAHPEDRTEVHVFKNTVGTVAEPTARLTYFMLPNMSLVLTWRIEINMGHDWLVTYVDAITGNTVYGVVNYVAGATYQVYRWGLNDPTEGNRTILKNPWDTKASSYTWISDGKRNYSTTWGNNAIAHYNPTGNASYFGLYRPSSLSLNFVYPYSPNQSHPESYIDAAITQVFYTVNTYHDLLYLLGFTEAAGNFQANNQGRGGKENDYVILNVQNGVGKNNAAFSSPPDGRPGTMQLYMWDSSPIPRDSAFDAGIVIHEYTHGVSHRLTGGPDEGVCLGTKESRGMGEGWGDFMSIVVRLKPEDHRNTSYPMSPWPTDKPEGIRLYPYSTRLEINPLNYTSLNDMGAVHQIGTVWATMLNEVLWNLIDEHGQNSDSKPTLIDDVPTDGRYLAMKLVLDAMALQPCWPTFLQARDAILDADLVLTGGKNTCAIWTGFAKRGLGLGASSDLGLYHNASYTVPVTACS